MTELFDQLLDWIRQNPEYAGLVVFSMSLAESLAIVGVLIPGVVILFGAGVLIGAGVLDFWAMCAWAIAGAVIGDGLSYWLGHHFEYLTERWRWFRLHPDYLQKGITFFERYGDLSVALGRFFGPIRAVVPLVAGLMHMPPKRFYIANGALLDEGVVQDIFGTSGTALWAPELADFAFFGANGAWGTGPVQPTGLYMLGFELRDAAGDQTPPELEIADMQAYGSLVIVNGRTEPGATVKINDEPVSVQVDGSFSKTVQMSQAGFAFIRVVATDAWDNPTEVKRRVFVDAF